MYFEIPLRALDPGCSTKCRKSNWALIQKVLKKHSIPISNALVEHTIMGIHGAAEDVLRILYSFIHKRELSCAKNQKSEVKTWDLKLPDIQTPSLQTLFNKVSKLKDWKDVFQLNLMDFDELLSCHRADFHQICIHETKSNVLRILSFLWSQFHKSPTSRNFQLAFKILNFFVPEYIYAQPLGKIHILESIDSILPLDSFSNLEQKLGYISVISGYVQECLHQLEEKLSSKQYVYLCAGIQDYSNLEFWTMEVQRLILTTSLNQSLHPPVLALCSSLANSGLITQSMHTYFTHVMAQNLESELLIYSLCSTAIFLSSSVSGKLWENCVLKMSLISDQAMILTLIKFIIPLIPSHRELSATFVRLICSLNDLKVLYSPIKVQPIPYVLPIQVPSLSPLFISYSEQLSAGLAICFQKNYVPEYAYGPLLGLCTCSNPDINILLLMSCYKCVFLSINEQIYMAIREICRFIPPKTLPLHDPKLKIHAALLLTIAHFHVHDPTAIWLKIAVQDVFFHKDKNQSAWTEITEHICSAWKSILPSLNLKI